MPLLVDDVPSTAVNSTWYEPYAAYSMRTIGTGITAGQGPEAAVHAAH